MRGLLLLVLVLSAATSTADESFALIGAVLENRSARQPTFIALERAGTRGFIHVPADEAIVSVEPGSYLVRHIDFGKTDRSGRGTIYLNSGKHVRFEAVPGMITYVGIMEFKKRGENLSGPVYAVGMLGPEPVLEHACDTRPAVIAEHPMLFPQQGGTPKAVNLSCEGRQAGTPDA